MSCTYQGIFINVKWESQGSSSLHHGLCFGKAQRDTARNTYDIRLNLFGKMLISNLLNFKTWNIYKEEIQSQMQQGIIIIV